MSNFNHELPSVFDACGVEDDFQMLQHELMYGSAKIRSSEIIEAIVRYTKDPVEVALLSFMSGQSVTDSRLKLLPGLLGGLLGR